MEHPERICTYCGLERVWLWNQQKLKDGAKIYVDESGSRWAGRRCPECEKKRVRSALAFDEFTREFMEQELASQGYEITSKNKFPITVAKDGKTFIVKPTRAQMRGNKIVVENHPNTDPRKNRGSAQATRKSEDELVVLLFQTMRILPSPKKDSPIPPMREPHIKPLIAES